MQPVNPFNLLQALAVSDMPQQRNTLTNLQLAPPPNARLSPAQTKAVKQHRKNLKRAEDAPEGEPPTPEPEDTTQNRKFADTWDGVPVVVDQYENERWSSTWKESAVQCVVWDLKKPDDLDAYNNLLARLEPPTAPMARLVGAVGPVVAADGSCPVILHFREILWKKELT